MILLIATPIDVYGGFTFTIEADGTTRLVTTDPTHVASALAEMGVDHPEPLVKHAETWGSVEIAV